MKKLNVLQSLKEFNGDVIKDGDKPEMTLKNVLLTYISAARGLNPSESTSAYLAGLAIGMGGEECRLEQDQYDIVKRLVDENKFILNGQEQDVYGVLVSQQAKAMVDAATQIEKK